MGWASAPYDPRWEERHPRRAAVMSAAGPAANFLLFAIAFAILRIGLANGVWVAPAMSQLRSTGWSRRPPAPRGSSTAPAGSSPSSSRLNLILGVFNLMPFPPLDGVSVLGGLVPPVTVAVPQACERIRRWALVGLIIAWRVFPPIIKPILRAAVVAASRHLAGSAAAQGARRGARRPRRGARARAPSPPRAAPHPTRRHAAIAVEDRRQRADHLSRIVSDRQAAEDDVVERAATISSASTVSRLGCASSPPGGALRGALAARHLRVRAAARRHRPSPTPSCARSSACRPRSSRGRPRRARGAPG